MSTMDASRIIDGSGTIHLMGQIATITLGIKSARKIPRLTIKNDDLKGLARLN